MQWDIPPTLFHDVVERDLDQKYRQLIIMIYNNLTAYSPVDTGRYRVNHHVTFGSPSYAVDGGMGLQLPPTGTLPTVYIQNNLPYAVRLENGWSNQAPTGVYQNAFNDAVASFG